MAEVIRWQYFFFDACKASRRLQDFQKPLALYEPEHYGLIKELEFKLPLARSFLIYLVQGHKLLPKLEVFVHGVGRYFLTQS